MKNISVEEPEELDLLLSLRAGEVHAFDVLYNRYKLLMARNLLRLLKSEDLAQEILQNLFVKVWDNRLAIDPYKSFKAYLYRIAENMVIDYYRRSVRDKKIRDLLLESSFDYYSHIEERINKKESLAILHQAIDRLPPQRKQIFIRCRIDEKSYKEVAEEFGISVSTVNDHLLKSNKFLKELLSKNPHIILLFLLADLL